jgi:hypothetical protein
VGIFFSCIAAHLTQVLPSSFSLPKSTPHFVEGRKTRWASRNSVPSGLNPESVPVLTQTPVSPCPQIAVARPIKNVAEDVADQRGAENLGSVGAGIDDVDKRIRGHQQTE